MMSTISNLSKPRQQLLELMRRVGFGRINSLRIQNGEPLLNPPPRITFTHRFGKNDSQRPEAFPRGSALKDSHINLFRLLDEIGTGTIDQLVLADGLPLHAERTG